jgi:topoisomerase IA-like protein
MACYQVISSHTPKKIAKSLKRGGPKVPDGADRYILTSPAFKEILTERDAKRKQKQATAKKVTTKETGPKKITGKKGSNKSG